MTKRRALIVEDNREIAALVKLHLRDVQCEADIAADGKRGLELASGRRYDLVVLDLMLPEIGRPRRVPGRSGPFRATSPS